MKKLLFNLLLLFVFSSTLAQTTTNSHPGVHYNDLIVGEHRVLLALVTDYLVQTIHSDDFKKIEEKRIQVIQQVESAIETISGLGDFQGDTKMRDEALSVLKMYKEAYTQDFKTIKSLKAQSQKSYEAMTQYLMAEELAEAKLNRTLKRFNKAQEEFAKRHGLVIDMGDEKHPMDIIFQVYKYNRAVFLQYFKVFIQNEACLNALYKYDGAQLEIEREKLVKYANEAYTKLEVMKPYKEDKDYKGSAMAYISFHQKFAQGGMAELVKILSKQNQSSDDITNANKILDNYNPSLGKAEDAFHNANIVLLQTYIPQELHSKEVK